MTRITNVFFTALLCTLVAPAVLADDISLKGDGWYSWEVEAGKDGRKSCCYTYSNGNVYNKGCKLDKDGMNEFTINEPCEVLDSSMKIYVEVRDGKVRDIRPLSSNCPVKSSTEVTAFNDVSTGQSIRWLEEQVQNNRKVADEAVMALSFHEKDEALAALFKILENTEEHRDNREQAMFWLVQSDYEEAFVYLDRLLD